MGYFRTHATRGAGIGGRPAIHLDDIAGGVELVTDTDVFKRSVGDVEQGSERGAVDTGVSNGFTRDPIHRQVIAQIRICWCVRVKGERAHVRRFVGAAAAAGVACCDAYVNGPFSSAELGVHD